MNKINLTTTNILIGIFSILFIISTLLSLSQGTTLSTNVLIDMGAEKLDLILIEGQVWRIIIAAFLHAGAIHFAVNIYAFLSLGNFIESFYGSKKLFTVFIFAAMFGSLASLLSNFLMSLATGELVNIPSVGASGGLFGFLGLLLGNKIKNDIYSPQLPIEEKSLYSMIIINLAIGFVFPFINNAAHIGGLLTGILFGLFLKPTLSYSENKLERGLSEVLFWIGLVLTVLSAAFQLLVFFR